MKLVTWNINSVRLRMPLLQQLAEEAAPDIICLQETKVRDELFPLLDIHALGYEHVHFRGEKSYNGVAILSRIPFTPLPSEDVAGVGESRHIAVKLQNGVELHNFYVPAGGDEPDTKINPKYAYKLDFVDAMRAMFEERKANDNIVMVGDFNIAPHEHDVWSHKQLLNVVSHTPPETTRLLDLQKTLDWVDVGRHFVPLEEKLYSWWSYRNQDWKRSNRGRRLDHIWVTRPLASSLTAHDVLATARDWQKPSDHVPVVVEMG